MAVKSLQVIDCVTRVLKQCFNHVLRGIAHVLGGIIGMAFSITMTRGHIHAAPQGKSATLALNYNKTKEHNNF